MRRWLLVIAGCSLGVLIGELALRFQVWSRPSFHVVESERAWALRPGARGWNHREGGAWVENNSQGLRNREIPIEKPPGMVRIAVLGDSYTEAREVAVEDNYCVQLEERLNRAETGFEVINFGVSGYGTTQELLTLERVWEYQPDLVILTLFSGNDIIDNSIELEWNRFRPFHRLKQDGDLVLDEGFQNAEEFKRDLSRQRSGYHQSLQSLSDHSRLVQLMLYRQARRRKLARARAPEPPIEGPALAFLAVPQDPRLERAWRVTEALIQKVFLETQAREVGFLAVVASHGEQVHPSQPRRSALTGELGEPDLFYPERRLRALAASAGFRLVCVAPEMQARAARTGEFFHGFADSPGKGLGKGHWNERGHALVGELLAEEVLRDR